jgi:hypothetical protein
MRIRWLHVALIVSLLANVGLAVGWGVQVLSEAVLVSDTGSTLRYLRAERESLQAMRTHFCRTNPAPDRADLLAWDASRDASSNPFDKDGVLWLTDVSVKFDEDGRLQGVCLPQTWGMLEDPELSQQDRAGEFCPLEPLCGSTR